MPRIPITRRRVQCEIKEDVFQQMTHARAMTKKQYKALMHWIRSVARHMNTITERLA